MGSQKTPENEWNGWAEMICWSTSNQSEFPLANSGVIKPITDRWSA